ncbi:hypothetical protein C0995_015296, partial [Termitomyces sp. Mi166
MQAYKDESMHELPPLSQPMGREQDTESCQPWVSDELKNNYPQSCHSLKNEMEDDGEMPNWKQFENFLQHAAEAFREEYEQLAAKI